MGKNRALSDFIACLKKCIWQDAYVLTQQDLAKSKSILIEEFKKRSWLEFAGKNGSNERRFRIDYQRFRLFFNGENNLPANEVLEQFFADYPSLKKKFIHRYSQGPMQTISTFFMYLKGKTPAVSHYMLCGDSDNSVVNFTLIAGELFAELVSSNVELMPFINEQQFVLEKKLRLPGGSRALFKFKPEKGFQLQTITVSNTLLKSIVMGEPLNFENEQVRQMAILEEHEETEIRKLARWLLNVLQSKQAHDHKIQEFFIAAARLLVEITQQKHSETLMAELVSIILKEVFLKKHSKLERENIVSCLLTMLKNRQPNDTATPEYFRAVVKLFSTIAKPEYSDTLMAKLARIVLTEALNLQPKIDANRDLPLVTNLLVQQTRLVKTPNKLSVIKDYHLAAKKVYAKPWGNRVGGAALIGIGILAMIGMAIVAGVTFGAGLLPASGLLIGLVFGLGGAAMVGGISGGVLVEYNAHQATRKKVDIEGASKITELAGHPEQVKNTFLRHSRARNYAEAHPDLFDPNFIKSINSNKTDHLDFLRVLKKNDNLSEKLSEQVSDKENQNNIASNTAKAGRPFKRANKQNTFHM